MLAGLDIPAGTFAGFILLLGVTMIAAPGVPGGAIMAALIMAVIPVIIFYLACQKYIIDGVVAGAVKG